MNTTPSATDIVQPPDKDRCNCIELTNKALIEQFDARLSLMFSLDGSRPDSIAIPTELIGKAKRGQKAPSLIADYCPFCGVRYVPETDGAS